MQKLRHILIGLTLLLFSNPAYADEMEQLNEGIGLLANKIMIQMLSKKVKLIAMGDFANSNGKTQFERNVEIGLVNSIVSKNRTDISVVERKNLSEVLKEQKLGNTGLLAPKTRAKLGKILGVEAIVTADTTVLKRKVTVNVRMYAISTGRILAAPSYTFMRSETIDELLSQPAEESVSYGGQASSRSRTASSASGYTPQSSSGIQSKKVGEITISVKKIQILNGRIFVMLDFFNHSDKIIGVSRKNVPALSDDKGNNFIYEEGLIKYGRGSLHLNPKEPNDVVIKFRTKDENLAITDIGSFFTLSFTFLIEKKSGNYRHQVSFLDIKAHKPK